MRDYECSFKLDGKPIGQRISASNTIEAQKAIHRMYPNSTITCFKCKEVKEEKK